MTLDLPTPPLPDDDEQRAGREPGWANGIARPSACPWAWPWTWPCAVAPCSWMRSASRSWSVITVKSTATPRDAVERGDGVARRGR